VEQLFISSGKGRIVFKSALVTGICDGHTVLDQCPGPQQTFGRDIAGYTVSCLLFEQVHEIITAHIEPGRQQVDGNVLSQMFSDIIQHRKDFGITAAVFYIRACVGIHGEAV